MSICAGHVPGEYEASVALPVNLSWQIVALTLAALFPGHSRLIFQLTQTLVAPAQSTYAYLKLKNRFIYNIFYRYCRKVGHFLPLTLC